MNVQWSTAQKEYLRANCESMKDNDIAKAIGKSIDSVRKMRQSLGLQKEPGRGVCKLKQSINRKF
jgi:bacterioferritin-associated ferredoxin